jgi:hypothetical protein
VQVLVYRMVASRPVEAGFVEGIGERYRATAQYPAGSQPGRATSTTGPTSPCVLCHCDGLHPDDPVAQRVSRRRQSKRYATENRLLPGLWTRYEYFRMDDAKGDAEDDAK